MSTILESDMAKRWLENFEDKDVLDARILAESVRLVSSSELETGLTDRISEIARLHHSGSLALFAVRELDPDIPIEAILTEETDSNTRALTVEGQKVRVLASWYRRNKSSLEPASYFPANNADSPSRSRIGVPTGSEATIGTFIRDTCERNGRKWLDHPSIETMRGTKTRTVILIDDIIGSGTRLRTFIESLFKNRTFRSWFSLKRFKIHVVTFAATAQQLDRLSTHPRIEKVHFCIRLSPGDASWGHGQMDRITDLCKRYAEQTSRKSFPLGYKEAFTNICFQHKCPNTAPAILWAGTDKWKALFNVRPILDIRAWPTSLSETERQKRVLEAIRQTQLSTTFTTSFLTAADRQLIIFLALIARGIRTIPNICAALQIPEIQCIEILRICQTKRLVSDMRLTAQGKAELNFAKKRREKIKRDMKQDVGYYYPKSLRESSR